MCKENEVDEGVSIFLWKGLMRIVTGNVIETPKAPEETQGLEEHVTLRGIPITLKKKLDE